MSKLAAEIGVQRYYYMAEVPKREAVFENWPSVQAIGMTISVHRRGGKVTGVVRLRETHIK